MSDLQTTYYIVGIVFMVLALIILLVIVIALIVIRSKINAIHHRVEEKLSTITSIAEKGGAVVDALKKVSNRVKR